MATSPFPAMYGSYADPSSMGGGGAQSAIPSRSGVDPRKKKMIDQIMQGRQQAMQSRQMLQTGGPGYLDYIDQMRLNPFATFY